MAAEERARAALADFLSAEEVSSYLTECIHSLVLESQLPHKIVNLSFTISDIKIKLTIFCEH